MGDDRKEEAVKKTISFYWSGDDIGYSRTRTVLVDFSEFHDAHDIEITEDALREFGNRIARDFGVDDWWTEKMGKERDEWIAEESKNL